MSVPYPRAGMLLFGLISFFTLPVVNSPTVVGGEHVPCGSTHCTYKIAPLIIHTDLSATSTNALADRVKSVLADVSAYWKRPVRGPLECFVVDDPGQWKDSQLPNPLARLVIARVEGATQARQVGHGIHARNIVRVFASSKKGVVEHEIVHAYCGQTFGVTGPLWYQEGMAQLFALGADRKQGVNCSAEMLQQLQSKSRMTIAQTLAGGQATRQLFQQFSDKENRCAGLAGRISVADWNQGDERALEKIKQFYCWNWFLCHFLFHDTNYRTCFRKVGQAYLTRREDRFTTQFQPVWRELEFEYRFTLDHLVKGYRVDLCSWDWEKPFHELPFARSVRVRIVAARGYQATGVQVVAGRRYHYRTEGSWSRARRSAAGGVEHVEGKCLEAVILHGDELTDPFALDCSGDFYAPCTGRLHVRCRTDWDCIADNEGGVVLVLAR